MTFDQIAQAQGYAHDGKVFLQIYRDNGERTQQIEISTWARDWCLHLNQPDARFYAEIGYYRHDGGFEVISRSGMAATPRDTLSWRTDTQFVTIPLHFSYTELLKLVKDQLLPDEELAEGLARLQQTGFQFPFETGFVPHLSEGARQSLLEYVGSDIIRRTQSGSGEIVEIFRQRLQSGLNGNQWISSISSPFGSSFGAPVTERGFHMHVNAELIIYGGTEPQARVRIDGTEIPLSPDGSFSYHFNFKDGKYHIPIDATSPDGKEIRSALLSFLRLSAYDGDVTATPQEPRPAPLGETD